VGPKKGDKEFHVQFRVKLKLELIEEPQSNVSVAAICTECGLKEQNMANITQTSCVLRNVHYLLMQTVLDTLEKVAKGNLKP
jgi:hypothetical protein